MQDAVFLTIGNGIELRMSRAQAEALVRGWRRQLDQVASSSVVESGAGLVLPDDHPLWERHSGLDGHRDSPEWDEDAELAAAEAFYQPIKGKAKVFFDLLIDHPGQQLTVDDLCRLADGVFSGSRSIAGAIYGLYRSHQASGRRYPFYWWEGQPTCYAMKPSVAKLFSQARDGVGL